MRRGGAAGFTLAELLVSLAVFSVAMASVAGLLMHNARVNRTQQVTASLQMGTRNCMAMVSQVLRSAGWDPLNTGFAAVALDPDLTDDISTIEVFADLNADGDTDDLDEAVLIRHVGTRVEWRRTASGAFSVLATNIVNDADGDGTPEPMFVPDSVTAPRRIAVRLVARAPFPEASTGRFASYAMQSEVALRNAS